MIQSHVVRPARAALKGLPGQVREHLWWYGAVLVVILLTGFATIYLQQNTNVEVTEMFEDPVAFAGLPLYIGVFTYLSATALIVAGSLLIFAAWAARQLAGGMKIFVIVMGVLLLWLGLDDVFMIHEWVGLQLARWMESDEPGYDRQWLESYVFVAYAIAWVGVVIAFARQILRTPWILLVLTFTAFGISVILDISEFIPFLPDATTRKQRLVTEVAEDLAKLGGTGFALAYALHVARGAVQGLFADEPDPAPHRFPVSGGTITTQTGLSRRRNTVEGDTFGHDSGSHGRPESRTRE